MTNSEGQQPELRGVVRDDPVASIPIRELRLNFRAIVPQVESELNHGVAPLPVFEGVLLAVGFRDDAGHHTLGSAVLVGPGIALCAHHVVEDHLAGIRDGSTYVICQGLAEDGLLLWEVRNITSVGTTDLCVLCMVFRTELPGSGIALAHPTTRMPAVGEELVIGGFTAAERTTPISRDMRIRGDTRFSKGRVIDVYPEGRDRMLPGPSLAVECPALGGMSGGPVFDSRGYLVGVLTSSIEGNEVAFVSHIWPALKAPIAPVWPPFYPTKSTLLHLGSRHAVAIEAPDAFGIDVEYGEMVLRYRQWS